MAEAKAQKPKYFADQFDDEEVLFVFRHHPVVMRKGLVFGSIGLLLGVIPVAIMPTLGFGWLFGGLGAGVVLMLLIMLPFWVAWYFSVFIVTDQRFIQITQKGFFHKSVVDITLSQIQMVNYEIAGVQETLLGFGTIMIQTYVGDLVIKEVHHPAKIQKKLAEILRELGIVQQSRPFATTTDTEQQET